MQKKVIHIFREGNTLADALDNEVIDRQTVKEYNNFTDLSAKVKKYINMEKS